MGKEKFYKNGLRFECTGCGNCCKITDGYVRITHEEMNSIKEFLSISKEEFIQSYVQEQQEESLDLKSQEDGACIFLQNDRCTIYEVRPEQCRTFPFWPENLKSAYRWKLLKDTCDGIDQGDIIPYEHIRLVLEKKVSINSLPGEGVNHEKDALTDL